MQYAEPGPNSANFFLRSSNPKRVDLSSERQIPVENGSLRENEPMEIRAVSSGDVEQDATSQPSRRGGGSRSGIAAALSRAPFGGGLAHWGGSRSVRASAGPVDVVGASRLRRLPSTD